MSKKKKTTQSQQTTNTYGQIVPQETADTAAVRAWQPTSNPAIPYAFGAAKNRLRSSLSNVLGGDYSATERDQILGARDAELTQQEAQALSEEGAGMNAQELAKRQFLAQLNAPRIVQTGGSAQGTTVQSDGGAGLLSGLLNVGLAFA